MEIPTLTQKRWWFCKKAGAQNSITIAKWFARNSEHEIFKTYRSIFIRLANYSRSENLATERCVLAHDLLLDMMLDDIFKLYGKEIWRIVRNNITYMYKDNEQTQTQI